MGLSLLPQVAALLVVLGPEKVAERKQEANDIQAGLHKY